MRYDFIHDTQYAFRDILKAFSFPGTIHKLNTYVEKLDTSFNQVEYIFGSVFLDQEVTYFSHDQQLSFETIFYTKKTTLHDADYIFLTSKDINFEMFSKLKSGTMIDPHQSALLFVKVNKISSQNDYELTGPGIKDFIHISLNDDNHVIETYIKLAFEYPLGIDLIIYTDDDFIALPRTTLIKKVQ